MGREIWRNVENPWSIALVKRGEDYFLAWLDALEGFLSGRGLAQTDEMRMLKEAWTEAYLSTPHGSPVSID